MSTPQLRQRYERDGVQVTSPERLVVALYDRLLADLVRADHALANADRAAAHEQLVHAQRIVEELQLALDPAAWPGATELRAVYDFVHRSLVEANVHGDRALVASIHRTLAPLADAWRDAYQHQAAAQAARAVAGQA